MREHRARFNLCVSWPPRKLYTNYGIAELKERLHDVKTVGTTFWEQRDRECSQSGGAGDAVFDERGELGGVAGGRQAGLAGADNGERLFQREMTEGFFEGAGKLELRSFGRDAKDGFAEAEDAVGGGFECLGGGIVGGAGDNNLQRVMGKKSGGEAVGGSEEAVLGSDTGEGFKRFLREVAIAIVAGKGVHANEGDGGDGIRAGRGRILKRLAANVEAAHGRGVGRTIEEAPTYGVAVASDAKVHRFLGGGEIAGIERGFVSVEKGDNAEDLIVERAF